MKFWSHVVALVALVALAGFVKAEGDKPAPKKAEKIKGTVVRVDGVNVVISAGKEKEAKEVTVVTDDKTVVKIDGETKKVADLTAGLKVVVSPAEGVATSIEAHSAKPAGKGGDKGGDKGGEEGGDKGGAHKEG